MNTLICALQFGSARINAAAAIRDEQGNIRIIATESEVVQALHHNRITQVEEVASRTRQLMQRLNAQLRPQEKRSVDAAYVGANIITPEITAAVRQAGIRMAGQTAMAQASARILTTEERQQGCLLVDMGQQHTTVSIYADGALKHLAVIPLGGDVVSSDITTYTLPDGRRLTFNEAENVKCQWSNAADDNSAPPVRPGGILPIAQHKLNTIVMCRYEEIAANIAHQVKLAGIKDLRRLACIVIGGPTAQRGLSALLCRRLEIDKIEIRSYSGIQALLDLCTMSCEKIEEPIIPLFEEPEAETTSRPEARASEADKRPNRPAAGNPTADKQPDAPHAETPTESEEEEKRPWGLKTIFKDLFGGVEDGK